MKKLKLNKKTISILDRVEMGKLMVDLLVL